MAEEMTKDTKQILTIVGAAALLGGIFWFMKKGESEAKAEPKAPALTPAPLTPGAIVTVTKDFQASDLTTLLTAYFKVGDKIQIGASAGGVTGFTDPAQVPQHLFTTTETIYGV